jgi:hypothetical protein
MTAWVTYLLTLLWGRRPQGTFTEAFNTDSGQIIPLHELAEEGEGIKQSQVSAYLSGLRTNFEIDMALRHRSSTTRGWLAAESSGRTRRVRVRLEEPLLLEALPIPPS